MMATTTPTTTSSVVVVKQQQQQRLLGFVDGKDDGEGELKSLSSSKSYLSAKSTSSSSTKSLDDAREKWRRGRRGGDGGDDDDGEKHEVAATSVQDVPENFPGRRANPDGGRFIQWGAEIAKQEKRVAAGSAGRGRRERVDGEGPERTHLRNRSPGPRRRGGRRETALGETRGWREEVVSARAKTSKFRKQAEEVKETIAEKTKVPEVPDPDGVKRREAKHQSSERRGGEGSNRREDKDESTGSARS